MGDVTHFSFPFHYLNSAGYISHDRYYEMKPTLPKFLSGHHLPPEDEIYEPLCNDTSPEHDETYPQLHKHRTRKRTALPQWLAVFALGTIFGMATIWILIVPHSPQDPQDAIFGKSTPPFPHYLHQALRKN